MADEETKPKKTAATKKKGLPPISPRNNDAGDESKPQVTKRKKKKPVAETVESSGPERGEGDSEKPTPRRRARSKTPSGATTNGGVEGDKDATVTTPKKKKAKPKPKPEGGDQAEEVPASDRSATSGQEVRCSDNRIQHGLRIRCVFGQALVERLSMLTWWQWLRFCRAVRGKVTT